MNRRDLLKSLAGIVSVSAVSVPDSKPIDVVLKLDGQEIAREVIQGIGYTDLRSKEDRANKAYTLRISGSTE